MDIMLIVGFGSAILGALTGGAVGFFARANRSVPLKDTTEKLLADSVPQATVEQVNALANRALDQVDSAAQIVKDALQFMRDVSDRKPNTVPPVEVNTSAGAVH